jgi:hypothetical protein
MKRSHEPLTGPLHDFELHLKESGKTPTTVCNYARLVRQFLKFVGNESPERISEDLVRAFLTASRIVKLNESTLRESVSF